MGYLFLPPGKTSSPLRAVIMLHGRGGAYSSLAKGTYNAGTLTKRHVFWGRHWAKMGYAALLVDSFGPRGFPAGFPIHSYADRPKQVSELTARPLDAYGALSYLKTRKDIDGHRIAMQGWSNGGSTAIAAMSDDMLRKVGLEPGAGFRGAVAFYPGCGLHGAFKHRYHPYAGVRIFSGDNDEEVSARTCSRLTEVAKKGGGDVEIKVLAGATHGFDDPGKKHRAVAENVQALESVVPVVNAYINALIAK
ncbi:dienelactone hydrolase family protein [Rhizobium oryzicola]|uniref:Dienelactone hydrolase family protein n=1 Tax=Rhizobium oryzicola TaxID=1232668 RepID=A0ABT8SQZ4_9HYPH|nr:dienelactone hydrolase family protein [Rhizobium oryzicola]MDO1580857.1 dienelactone hydrolase family protein [Rhizobium oryzicola]